MYFLKNTHYVFKTVKYDLKKLIERSPPWKQLEAKGWAVHWLSRSKQTFPVPVPSIQSPHTHWTPTRPGPTLESMTGKADASTLQSFWDHESPMDLSHPYQDSDCSANTIIGRWLPRKKKISNTISGGMEFHFSSWLKVKSKSTLTFNPSVENQSKLHCSQSSLGSPFSQTHSVSTCDASGQWDVNATRFLAAKDHREFKRLCLLCSYSRVILETVFTFNHSFR